MANSYTITTATFNNLKSKSITPYKNGVAIVASELPLTLQTTDTFKLVAAGGTFSRAMFSDPIMDNDYYFTLSEGNTTAAITPPAGGSLSLYYYGTVASPPPPPPPAFHFTSKDVANWAAANFQMKLNDVLVVGAGTINIGDVITVVGINNYKFIYAKFFEVISDTYLVLTLAPDALTATGTMTRDYSSFEYSLESGAAINVKGSNSVYAVADDDLSKITATRFVQPVGGEGRSGVDYGRFILGLIKLPFAVDASNIVGTEQVLLGPLETGVFAGLMNVDRLTYSLGSIAVAGSEGNVLDFADTEAVLHLPYTNPVKLDIDYVVGQTVTVDLLINLYDGTADYNITSTKLGGVVVTNKVRLDIGIPFASPDTAPGSSSLTNIDFGVDNGVKTAYIEILRKGQVLPYGFFTAPVVVESTIGSQTGYVVVEDVNLKVPRATASEIAEIEQLLGGGVILT